MAETTNISWAHSTFNPWVGCTQISPGCDHCYAKALVEGRFARARWGQREPRSRTSKENWAMPRRWERQAEAFHAAHGCRRRVFCASLADVFDNAVDPQWRADLWSLIRETQHLDWLILTKRIGNAAAMLPDDWGDGYRNVWLGATVVNQEEADRYIPTLLSTPALLRWLSIEPLLGRIDLRSPCIGQAGIDWVIVGGESGPDPRSMRPEWVSFLRRQCHTLNIPFFFKQWGGSDKDHGGSLIDGREIKEVPGVQEKR